MTLHSDAILFENPGTLSVRRLDLAEAKTGELVVSVEASGISTGTERLLFSGEMPAFPGMGYPLVPGYEAVGTVLDAGDSDDFRAGDRVFVPGSTGFKDARGLFGASASTLRVPAARVTRVPAALGTDAVLLALAATAHHAVAMAPSLPGLIIGHGVLGRLAARIVCSLGGAPRVWDNHAGRQSGATGYAVTTAADDDRRDHAAILDVSGDPAILDQAVPRLARGGTVVLAGFYKAPVAFAFPPAFMREAKIAIAAEWQPADMAATLELVAAGSLSLAGLVTHAATPANAHDAYRTAFEDMSCLKMILEWGATQ